MRVLLTYRPKHRHGLVMCDKRSSLSLVAAPASVTIRLRLARKLDGTIDVYGC